MSLREQRARIERWAEQQGAELVAVFADEGLSGADPTRPGLQAAVNEACRRRCHFVISSLSRLARSVQGAMSVAEQLDKSKATLVSLSEAIDTRSASGRLLLAVLAACAAWEREVLAERITSVMDHLRRQRKRISGIPPYGFTISPNGVDLVPVEEEQAALSVMLDLRDAGQSFAAIARHLDELGVAPRVSTTGWKARSVATIIERERAVRGAEAA
jgi:site-specific DNA recombinase